MQSKWWRGLIAVLSGLALAGCTAGPTIVVAHARGGAAPTAHAAPLQAPHYRFVTRPAVAGQPAAAELEPMAQAALSAVGAVRDDAHPNVSVEVSATGRHGQYDNRNGWGLPPAYWGADYDLGLGKDVGVGWVGRGGHAVLDDNNLIPIWDGTVTLVMRDLATNRVIYRSSARHRGSTTTTSAVLATLFRAALQGYPNPPSGPRRRMLPLAPQPTSPVAARSALAATDGAKPVPAR